VGGDGSTAEGKSTLALLGRSSGGRGDTRGEGGSGDGGAGEGGGGERGGGGKQAPGEEAHCRTRRTADKPVGRGEDGRSGLDNGEEGSVRGEIGEVTCAAGDTSAAPTRDTAAEGTVAGFLVDSGCSSGPTFVGAAAMRWVEASHQGPSLVVPAVAGVQLISEAACTECCDSGGIPGGHGPRAAAWGGVGETPPKGCLDRSRNSGDAGFGLGGVTFARASTDRDLRKAESTVRSTSNSNRGATGPGNGAVATPGSGQGASRVASEWASESSEKEDNARGGKGG